VRGTPNTWETRIRFGADRRKRFFIRNVKTAEVALERAKEMAEMAARLVSVVRTDEVEQLLKAAGEAENTARLDVVRNLVRRVTTGEYKGAQRPKTKLPADISFRAFGALWTEGELHRMWPDHVEEKATAADDARRLAKHVYPVIGGVPVREISLELCDETMSALSRSLSKASRRHVAQVIVRLMHLAAYPARLVQSSPIPRGWLPKLGRKVNFPILLPREDLQLMEAISVPLNRRLVYGFLHREGVRRGDAERLRWRQVDLELRTLRIESDKTQAGRLFMMNPGVQRALRLWKQMKPQSRADDLVFADEAGELPEMQHLARRLREDLLTAGVTRPELFEGHGTWARFNVHTLRHSYVTRSLARGVPEDTVRQHTAHISNELRRYREFATSIEELHLEDLTPLDVAIPEFRGVGQRVGQEVGQLKRLHPAQAPESPEKPRLIN
jgi:integrase